MEEIHFNGFDILDTLPRGGMSTVYKARQLSLDRLVAIKALPPTMGIEPADVEKFMAEARITAGLKHPNIVQVYDFGRTERGVYYFVMEYISGYSVAAWIRRKRCLSEENSLLCALSVAQAMSYAWDKAGIVHCAIKPDNVIIDGDGTVKVADMGLAMSVRSISGSARSKEKIVLGTPNYISPEQSRGDEKLDCRADIYSLGAMLYHCMTGAMPFENIPPVEVMDRQITDQIPDPHEINPGISVWSACLIEKMMAKNPLYRQKDWRETIRDISNVRSEMMPREILSADIASTVRRSATRESRISDLARQAPPPAEKPAPDARPDRAQDLKTVLGRKPPLKVIAALAAMALLFAAAWGIFSIRKEFRRAESVPAEGGFENLQPGVGKAGQDKGSGQEERERRAGDKFNAAAAWFKANPASVDEAAARFAKLAEETKGTKYADQARREARRIEQILTEMKAVMSTLDKAAAGPAALNRFVEAAAVYEKYRGPYEKETASARRAKAQACLAKQGARIESDRKLNRRLADQQLQHAADEIAWIIVEDDVTAAAARARDLALDLPLISTRLEFKNLSATLRQAVGCERVVLDSFRAQKDQEVSIAFMNGTQKLVVREVRSDSVVAEEVWKKDQGTITLRRDFNIKDLALAEKISRVGYGDRPEYALMRVVLALQDGDYQRAGEAAAGAGPLLAKPLSAAIAARAAAVNERRARQAMASMMRLAGVACDDALPEPHACLQMLRGSHQASRPGTALVRAVELFRSKFGNTGTAARYESVLGSMTNTAAALHAPGQTAQDKAAPSQAAVREAFLAGLLEDNAGLREDQVWFQSDDSGQVVAVEIISTNLKDIRALESLSALQQLTCAGVRHNAFMEMPLIAPLSDLTPLRNLSLRQLTLNHTRVKDISVLSRMPLATLNLAYTKVNDFQPLRNMPLKSLDISQTSARDLRPMAGIALERLNISGTEISDLSPLAGMPLGVLLAGLSRVKDLTPLRSLPLRSLVVRGTEVTELSPLRGLPLEFLDLGDTGVRDISALRGMRIRELYLRNTRIKSIECAASLPLEKLVISGTAVRDISALKGMPLHYLDLRNTSIGDLSPLNNATIEELWLDDFSGQMNSDKYRALMAVLQTMPGLKSINGQPVQAWSGRKRE